MGVLLPPSVAAVVANAALAIDRRVAVNLNYTMTPEVINDCISQCGIRHVFSSRRVMERLTCSSTPKSCTWKISRTGCA